MLSFTVVVPVPFSLSSARFSRSPLCSQAGDRISRLRLGQRRGCWLQSALTMSLAVHNHHDACGGEWARSDWSKFRAKRKSREFEFTSTLSLPSAPTRVPWWVGASGVDPFCLHRNGGREGARPPSGRPPFQNQKEDSAGDDNGCSGLHAGAI